MSMSEEEAIRICRLICGKKNKKGKREFETFARLQMQLDYTIDEMAEAIETLIELSQNKDKIIEKLEENIAIVEKCDQDLIKPYYDESIKMINTSFMTKKEKEEFINKRNCLLVQKATLEEVLELLDTEK